MAVKSININGLRLTLDGLRLALSICQEDTNYMWNALRQFFLFRVGQNTSRGVARMLGFGRLAAIAGLVGGYRYMRRHQAR